MEEASLSFLMGAELISDDELLALGISIVEGAGTSCRSLSLPASALAGFRALVREKLSPGFWNEIVGPREIGFTFKLADGAIVELSYSDSTREQIAWRCSALNGDPIEKTSDVLRYLADNAFYRDFMARHYLGSAAEPCVPEA